ncbi:hypothetical protein [Bombilactobacillus thymidiniphilus]|uniref:Uncharacterized protein n=1 Tax=Bombilactobacillus thymidiniphilus TaxID=2923363 RepID=A0ABY4PDN8_9LACO|nr:hypothetical protein [Bombilactobacillus thymidiniphilus]UQS83685.1 hypothetical protein MOO47_00335 [Bombilactobacillus thymidiniphilus]
MNKRQRCLTSAGTFLGLVCGLVLTQQVVSADTNPTAEQNMPAAVQTASTDNADGNSTQVPVAQQQATTQASIADDNNDIVTDSPSATSSTTVASNDTTVNNNVSTNVAANIRINQFLALRQIMMAQLHNQLLLQ